MFFLCFVFELLMYSLHMSLQCSLPVILLLHKSMSSLLFHFHLFIPHSLYFPQLLHIFNEFLLSHLTVLFVFLSPVTMYLFLSVSYSFPHFCLSISCQFSFFLLIFFELFIFCFVYLLMLFDHLGEPMLFGMTVMFCSLLQCLQTNLMTYFFHQILDSCSQQDLRMFLSPQPLVIQLQSLIIIFLESSN